MNRPMWIAGTLIFLLTLAFRAAAAPSGTVTSNAMIPFDVVLGTASEDIAVSGKIHVTAAVQDQGETTLVQVHVNLADASGVGKTTGAEFHFTSNMMSSQEVSPEILEASLEYFINMTGKLLKGDVAADISSMQRMLLKLKFDAAHRLIAAGVAPFDFTPCTEE